jgi:heme/copper-type cytochrome/quinol oxidase subunit 2
MSMAIGEAVLAVIAVAILAIVAIIAMRRNDVSCRDPSGKGCGRRKMAIGEAVLAVIAVAILAIVAIIAMRRPREREKKQTHAVCDIFCKALYEAKQFATYVEGRSTINEAMRERLIGLLRGFLGKLDSVKSELEPPIAYELDHIRREVETIIERIEHIGLTGNVHEDLQFVLGRLEIMGRDKLGCGC